MNHIPVACSMCHQEIGDVHALLCDSCQLWCHIECTNVSEEAYDELQKQEEFDWSCPAHQPPVQIQNPAMLNQQCLDEVNIDDNVVQPRFPSRERKPPERFQAEAH